MSAVNQPSIWVAFVLSVVLHVAGFELAEQLPREPLLPSPTLIKPVVRLIQKPQQYAEGIAQTAIEKRESNDQLAKASALPISPAIQNIEAEQIATNPEGPETESIFFKSIRYFESSEVDNSSELFEEWVLRTQGIKSIAIVKVQLTLYINEDGRLDKFVILNSSLSDVETELLLKDFAQTLFKPAFKNEKPVPSQKNVEIILDPNPPVFRLPNFLNNFLPASK